MKALDTDLQDVMIAKLRIRGEPRGLLLGAFHPGCCLLEGGSELPFMQYSSSLTGRRALQDLRFWRRRLHGKLSRIARVDVLDVAVAPEIPGSAYRFSDSCRPKCEVGLSSNDQISLSSDL